MSEERDTIRWERGEDGIVVLVLDDPQQSANTMNAAYVASMGATIDRLEAEREELRGVIISSAKRTFFAGGDLNDLLAASPERRPQIAGRIREIKAQLRRLETLGVPVAAAVGGAALGGGLEIALATHHRVALDAPGVVVGFPEVTLGLLPGAGGVVRSVRLLGVLAALEGLLLEGQRLTAAEAHRIGIVDALVGDEAELLPAARRWILAHPDACARWDAPGYTLPGGSPADLALATVLPTLPARLRRQLKGANYPAPRNILAAAIEGAQVGIDAAFEVEGRYFVELVTGQIAKNMIGAYFFDMAAVRGGRGRETDRAPFAPAKMVVLGAGMMGSGIAHVCAAAGIDVVLKDVSVEAAQRGRRRTEKLLDRAVEQGRRTREQADEVLARITATDDPAQADGAELVIEAVFEDPAVKQAVFAEIEQYLAPGALLASNTSTLPITELALGVARPTDFIGLHFFSPVERMALLEIIRGEQTSEPTLHRALDLAALIGKTPIVVNDSRGFFTSRVIATFIGEGIAMLLEGIPAASIEQASAQAGYPAPVLALSDEINLKLLRTVREQTRIAQGAHAPVAHPADTVIDRMIDDFARPGRLEGAGFYEYDAGARTRLWPGLHAAFGTPAHDAPFEDLKERLLFIEALEAVRCVDEGVIESVADANIGSLLGIGYPGWTGGVLSYIDGYEGGAAGFVRRADELATRYGARFTAPERLRAVAAGGERYRDTVQAGA